MAGLGASLLFFTGLYLFLAIAVAMLVRVGVLSLAHGGCAAVGAVAAVAAWNYTGGGAGAFGVGLLAAVASGGSVAFLMGLVIVRLQGDAVLVVSLLFVVMVRISIDLSNVLGGSAGVRVAVLSGVEPTVRNPVMVALIWLCVAGLSMVVRRGKTSGLLSVVDAIRNDSQVAGLTGLPERTVRLWLFSAVGAVAGATGGFYAAFLGHVSASAFDLWFAILVFLMGVVGWLAGPIGSLGAVCLLYLAPESLRLVSWRLPVHIGRLESLNASDLWPLLFATIVGSLAWVRYRADSE